MSTYHYFHYIALSITNVKLVYCYKLLTAFRSMFDNTKGIVFYSTPHLGSALASYSSQARHLILPSVEVKELCQSKCEVYLQT